MPRASFVSIGLPVYNAAQFLRTAVDSLLGQTHGDLELIISDNCSTDSTPEICSGYARQDSRVRFIRQTTNLGVDRNHAVVFELADSDSEYFRWAAADDVSSPDMVKEMVTLLGAQPAVVAVVPDTINIDADGNTLQHGPRTLDLRMDDAVERLVAILTRGYPVVYTYGLMRRSTLLRTSRRWHYYGWDFILLLELALAGQIAQPSGAVLYRRHHGGEASRARSLAAYKSWVNPTLKAQFLLPHWRLACERLRVVLSAPLPLRQKARSLGWVLRHSWWQQQALRNDFAAAYRTLAGRGDEIPF